MGSEMCIRDRTSTQKIILIRPEESEAAYINKESKTMKIVGSIVKKFPNEKKIVLSRYKAQSNEIKRRFGRYVYIESKPVSGKDLLDNVDCFIGSGGTMTAEAGLLGIPTISLNAVPNRIEDFLVKNKIIVRSESQNRILREITLSLNDPQIIKKRKQTARKFVTSFEDPYQVLLRTIRVL